MQEGKIIIKNNPKSQVKIKTEDGNKYNVRKDFDFTVFRDLTKKLELDCEFEYDENENKITKIIIGGKIVPFDEVKIKAKKEKEAKEKAEKKLKEENKETIEFHKNDFVKIKNSYLPEDTSNAIKDKTWRIDNFALKLNKTARFEKDKFQFFKTDKGRIIFQPKHIFDNNQISEITKNNLNSAKSIFGKKEKTWNTLELNPDWRMIVGLGGESVYETSITLHHIYGIPYIPASSIKGVVRNYIINEYFGNPEKVYISEDEKEFPLVNAEHRALTTSEEFCKIFGCPKEIKKVIFENKKPKYQKDKNGKETNKYETEKNPTPVKLLNKEGKPTEHIGKITFFDAFPLKLNEKSIVVDVMNPHYGGYYDDKKAKTAPTDYLKTNPVFFLTVENTKFQFIIGSKKEPLDNFKIDGQNIEWWLKEALENHGIGAKTAVGYGRME